MPDLNESYSSSGSGNVLKHFQIDPLTIQEKSDINYGKQLAQYITSTVDAGVSNSYYWLRNTRFRLNRQSANGRYPMGKFQDLLEMNAKPNFVNISWSPFKVVNTIISRLVGRWMQRKEKIVVSAIDPLSVKAKEDQYEQAEFILYNREMVEALQQESGVQMISPDQFVPEDKDDLDLWQNQYQKLPEEILQEKGSNEILAANGFFNVLKEKLLHDSAEVGFVGTYTWMDEQGLVHVEWVKPENAIYSYSEYPDFRDTTWRGRVVSKKISEIRRKYGKEFGGKLTEEQLWKIAACSKEYQLNDKIRWVNEWSLSILRPYDEWNVDVVEFELRTLDSEGYTVTETKQNGSTIINKGWPKTSNGKKRSKLGDNQKYVEEDKWNIYRGVYIRTTQEMLEWGLKKNMIRPDDPKEIGNAEFSYSFYMYQSQDMRNIAVPEKIEEPVEQMILARLKMQQLVAKMKPAGAMVNVDAMQELDLGLASGPSSPMQVQKIYEQSGMLYYRGRDAEGNPIPVPITELTNSGFLPQMQGLIQLYQFHYQVLKDELGEDPNLITKATQPRVTAENVATSREEANAATDYMYNAYLYVMEETAKKVSCLLKASVKYGAQVYRQIMKEEDVASKQFSASIQMLPTEREIAVLEAELNQAIAANPTFVMYVDPFKIRRIAKDDVKLAELYFRQAQKRMLRSESEKVQQNAELNAKAQQESLAAKGEMDMQLKQAEAMVEMEKQKMIGDTENRRTVLAGFMKMVETGIAIPSNLQPLYNAVMENVALPAIVANQTEREKIQQQMQERLMVQQQVDTVEEQDLQIA